MSTTPSTLAYAENLMRRRQWSDAAGVFDKIQLRDAATEMKRLLSRNLAAMQSHRPEIYEQLMSLPATDAFGIAAAANGRPTVLARRGDGSVISLSGGADPLGSAQAILPQIKQTTPKGESVALCGLGDGYLLQMLTQNPPSLFMDTEQAIFVLEPQPQVVLHVLMIHDFTGPGGAIAAERFRWFVGPEWASMLNNAAQSQPSIGLPVVMLQQGLDSTAIRSQIQDCLVRIGERDSADKLELEFYYGSFDPNSILNASGSRPPRVLLLTTRFSTVLQYATRDTADAFRALGWEADS